MLIIRSSPIHAAGCYTTTPIQAGAHVVEYTGPRLTKKEGDQRYENCPYTYLFGLRNSTRVIDGHGIAAFINHSCDPNCETDEINRRVWIIAVRDIAAGEELTYDYNLYDGDFDAPCHCGAKSCRGTMYDPDVVKNNAANGAANDGNKQAEKPAAETVAANRQAKGTHHKKQPPGRGTRGRRSRKKAGPR